MLYRTKLTTKAIEPISTSTVTSARAYCCSKRTGRLGAIDLRRNRLHIGENLGRVLLLGNSTQDAFGVVIFAVVGVCTVIALLTFAGARRSYDQIGRGGLSIRDDEESLRPAPVSGAAATRERNDEIRQMLEAKNARRARRGEEPLDIDAELARLTAPALDPALRDEVRQLVIARNERRARQGKEPLDVDAEVERQLADLSGS